MTIKELYNQACHGAGAEPRRAARIELEALARADTDKPLYILAFFQKHNLDLAAYFASRPL